MSAVLEKAASEIGPGELVEDHSGDQRLVDWVETIGHEVVLHAGSDALILDKDAVVKVTGP